MDLLLPLGLIGWLYTIACGLALLAGAWLVVAVHLRGDRKQLALRVVDDSVLFAIWILGFAGGIGVLLGKSWSRPVLELFCWALIVLVTLSAWKRLRDAQGPRGQLALSIGLFFIPVVAVCAATIFTLRSEVALRALSG